MDERPERLKGRWAKGIVFLLVVGMALVAALLYRFRMGDSPFVDKGSGPKEVYLVLRSQYQVPMGHSVIKFQTAGLLAWVGEHWQKEIALEEMGCPSGISLAMEEWGSSPPENLGQLRKFVATIGAEGAIFYDDHAIQCLTDDDEIDTPWYLFDDVFAAAYPERVSYLLRQDWSLPEASGATGFILEGMPLQRVVKGEGEGCVYAVFLSAYDGMTVEDITGSYRFDGVRIPEFAKYLRELQMSSSENRSTASEEWPEELVMVRSLAQASGEDSLDGFLRQVDKNEMNRRCSHAGELNDYRFRLDNPAMKSKPGGAPVTAPHPPLAGVAFMRGDAASTVKDWLVFDEHLRLTEIEDTSMWIRFMREPLIQASSHLCQIRFIQETRARPGLDYAGNAQTWAYIFFDDLWLEENRNLGESILGYATGGEVLRCGEELEPQ
jgi:hypothetical protein